jgi:hypothetical protein
MRIDINIHEHEEALRGIVYTLMEEVVVVWRDKVLCLPKGTQSDGASIPIGMQWLVFPRSHPKALRAAFAHDMLYAEQPEGWSKADCDAMFRDILIEDGIRRTRAWTAWAGLKVGGWVVWNKYKKANELKKQEEAQKAQEGSTNSEKA